MLTEMLAKSSAHFKTNARGQFTINFENRLHNAKRRSTLLSENCSPLSLIRVLREMLY